MAALVRNAQSIEDSSRPAVVPVHCEQCRMELRVPTDYLNRRVQCKFCANTFIAMWQQNETPSDLHPVLVIDEQPTVESFCTANGAEVVVMFSRQVPADEVQLALRDALRTLQTIPRSSSEWRSNRSAEPDAGPRLSGIGSLTGARS